MLPTNIFRSLQFQNDAIIDHNIRKIITNFTTFKIDLYMTLRFTIEASSFQLLEKCILVNLLQKPASQCIIYIIERSQYRIRFFSI